MVASASWYPDPQGLHRLRYWNGNQWTSYVCDDGAAFEIPLAQGSDITSHGVSNYQQTSELPATIHYRRRQGHVGRSIGLVAAAAFVLCLGIAVHTELVVTHIVISILAICAAGSILWATIGLVRTDIVADQAGVTFKNIYRVYHASWDEIVRFEPPIMWNRFGGAGLRAVLVDGSSFCSNLYSASGRYYATFGNDVVSPLNTLLTQRQTSSPIEVSADQNLLPRNYVANMMFLTCTQLVIVIMIVVVVLLAPGATASTSGSDVAMRGVLLAVAGGVTWSGYKIVKRLRGTPWAPRLSAHNRGR